MKLKFLSTGKISLLPKGPGIYVFKKGAKLLYIGKAADIRERAKSHFQRPGFRDNLFVNQVEKIGFIETGSEIEALLLEANLIKKFQPKYNILWRDDKNYFYVGITKEGLPRVSVTHQPVNLKSKIPAPYRNRVSGAGLNLKSVYVGPFIEGTALKKALRFLRKVFPFYTVRIHPKAPCSWCHLKLCPGPNPDKKEYQENIKNLTQVLRGKKLSVLKELAIEMKRASQSQNYEKAAKIRDQIAALEKIISHSRIFQPSLSQKIDWGKTQEFLRRITKAKNKISRIEAYDVSNIQGKQATGSMVTFTEGKPDKNLYRKFKIKIAGSPNDIAMLKECLSRRFKHSEWEPSDLILIDGGKAQLNAALKSLKSPTPGVGNGIRVIALAKKENKLFIEREGKPIFLKNLPREVSNLILHLRDEAHRFALSYHRKLRDIDLMANL